MTRALSSATRLAPLALALLPACGTTPLDVVNLAALPDAGWTAVDAGAGGSGGADTGGGGLDAVSIDRVVPPRPLGLVAHWSFDEGAGIFAHDDSGNGYHGHLVGGTWVSTGRFGNALALTPGDYVAVNAFQDATPAWTVSAWVRFSPREAHGSWGAIVSTELTGGGWLVYLEGDAPYELPRLNFEFVRPSTNFAAVGCCSVLQSDVWYHVTAVADAFAGSVTIYDGTRPEATVGLATTLSPGDPTLFMGTWRALESDPTVGGWFSGTIDDVSIFSRALDPSEIAELDSAPPIPAP
jgi:Concanavalin A-like lectin/glucanases superfamily